MVYLSFFFLTSIVRAGCVDFFLLVSGFEDLYAVAEVRNSLCTVLPQHLPNEWQVAVLPLLGYGYHHFVLILQC